MMPEKIALLHLKAICAENLLNETAQSGLT